MGAEQGDRVGGYELVRLVDAGVQGQVWEASDDEGQTCALKIIFRGNEAREDALVGRERWERAVLIGASVRHPCLAAVLDAGEADEGLWVAMQLLEGQSLARRYGERRPPDIHEFASVMVCLCAALDALHGVSLDGVAGVVHRDVKPANVLASGHGTETFAWLVDLGTIKLLDGESTLDVGSLEFMAPEQIERRRLTGGGIDVWAAGAVACWLLTCHSPVPRNPDESRDEYYARRLERVDVAPRIASEEIPDWARPLMPVVARALSPRSAARGSALALAADIAAAAWPAGPPPELALLLAGTDLHAVETVALGDTTATAEESPALPGEGLLDLGDRVAERSGDGLVWRALGLLRDRAGRRNEATDAWNRAGEAGDPVAAPRTAAAVEERDGKDAARPLWQRADGQGSPAAAFRLACVALDAGQTDAAVVLLRRARDRGHGEAAYRLYRLLRADSAAVSEARDALELAMRRGSVEALRDAGIEAFDLGRISRAERLWQFAATRGEATASLKLARLHVRRGDPRPALDGLEGCSGAEVDVARGDALSQLGSREQARECWERARAAGSADASSALALAAWTAKDWPLAETLYRETTERGRAGSVGLGIALHEQGKLLDAELVYRSADPSPQRSLMLAALMVQRDRHDDARSELDESRPNGVAELWALRSTRAEIERLAPNHDLAALYAAELLRTDATEEDVARERSLPAFEHAADLGNRHAAEWVVHYSGDREEEQRHGLEALVGEDSTGWVSWKLAHLLENDGDTDAALRLLHRASGFGYATATLEPTFAASVDEDEYEALLRQADDAGSAACAYRLAELLQARLGAGHPDTEAACSRADLRGHASGATRLGLVLYAKNGATAAVEQAWRRAMRRKNATGAFNLGTLCETRGDVEEAARLYETAIALGHPDGYVALAEIEWSLGHTTRATQLAREADERHPSRRSALLLGDLLVGHERIGAVEAYLRADALEDARAAIELACLLEEPGATEALDRAWIRLTDDTSANWCLESPARRAELKARITAIRRRR